MKNSLDKSITTHVSNSERHDAREKAKERVAGLLGLEFEQRQAMQMRLIGIRWRESASEWIWAHGKRFSELWESGIRNIHELQNALYDEKESMRSNMAAEYGMTAEKWSKTFPNFDSMWENGDFSGSSEQVQAAIFILYNKTPRRK